MFGKGKSPGDVAFAQLLAELEAWPLPTDALDSVHEGAKASLAEVKALTEYEDGKASRLLTIVAFLSALVGAVFTRFATDYPWSGFEMFETDHLSALVTATYIAFFAYVLLVTTSVLIILIAVEPRFNEPKAWTESLDRPRSMLFYQGIIGVTAPIWGATFISLGTKKGEDLTAYYAKCYIAESYLVAQKVKKKLRLLRPGVGLLQVAMVVLLLFFSLYGASLILVKPSSATVTACAPLVAPVVTPPAPSLTPDKPLGSPFHRC
jgi:hypothetical protein